ncbi:hypothetical protein F751_6895 [Auxenochlorella protothecoides]|uniref:Uncharacterized protein n=1 Tax=Auxenochlorella protothecoides TaxID=3075 RepID=A0A087SDX3_AUXPR|nr:hypothetical protein F751_6895 [Auxenochlorella protothecoides]KFM23927.1 hypothetical protein F751_6895 [Auxenochlorella protothecoides]
MVEHVLQGHFSDLFGAVIAALCPPQSAPRTQIVRHLGAGRSIRSTCCTSISGSSERLWVPA